MPEIFIPEGYEQVGDNNAYAKTDELQASRAANAQAIDRYYEQVRQAAMQAMQAQARQDSVRPQIVGPRGGFGKPPPSPIDRAAAAISAAMKFQAMRGYQRDLASGVTPAEAMTKWGPLMFNAKGTEVGSAVTPYVRLTPPKMERMGSNTVIYSPQGQRVIPDMQQEGVVEGPGGTQFMRDMKGGLRQVKPTGTGAGGAYKANAGEAAVIRTYESEIKGIQKQLADPKIPEGERQLQEKRIAFLRAEMNAIGRGQRAKPAVAAQPAQAVGQATAQATAQPRIRKYNIATGEFE